MNDHPIHTAVFPHLTRPSDSRPITPSTLPVGTPYYEETPCPLGSIGNPRRKGDWMLTAGGTAYWPIDPRAEEVFITDIAHSLAMQCRYAGHSKFFYSVAEHSIHVSRMVPEEHALVALMHDATEAYVTDVPRPLKPSLTNFAEIEEKNWRVIAEAFDLEWVVPECVHEADQLICHSEMRLLMPTPPLPLNTPGEDPHVQLSFLGHVAAEEAFLERFQELWDARDRRLYPANDLRRAT